MERQGRGSAFRWLGALALAMVSWGCAKEKATLGDMSQEVAQREAKLRQDREAAAAREKSDLEALLPRIAEKRRPLDQAFTAIWASLPDAKSLKRRECPDAKISADTPDDAKRGVLLMNKEMVYLLTGKAKPPVDGGAEEIHTPAAYHASSLRRAEGPENAIFDAAPPTSAEQARARLEAIDYVMAHRYVGVLLITYYKEPEALGAKPTPARVEGMTVVFDREGAKALCQIEGSGESVAQSDSVATGALANEEAFRMYVHTTAKNIDAISKVLWVEGGQRRKR